MNGAVVGRAVNEVVRPRLRDAGFTKFAARKAWRFDEHTVELVTCRSFSSYIAGGVGCTTYSFAMTTGVLPVP